MEGKFIAKKGIAALLSVLSACGVASAGNEDQRGGATFGANQVKPTSYKQWRARRNSLAKSAPSSDIKIRNSLAESAQSLDIKGRNSLAESAQSLDIKRRNSLAESDPDLDANFKGKKIENISDILKKRVSRRGVTVGAASLKSGKVDSKSADKKSLVVVPRQSDPSRTGSLEAQDVPKKGTWNLFKVLGESFNGMYDGGKRLGLNGRQQAFVVLSVTEMGLYLAINKGVGEIAINVFVDFLATNIAKIFKKEGVFKTTREYYNVDMALQDELISKMIPGLHYLARVFASVKGNWIDFFVAFIAGCLGKPSSDLKEAERVKWMGDFSGIDMTFADAEESVGVLMAYIRTVGLNFRRTRLNMMMYRLGARVRALAKNEVYNYDNEEPA